MINLKNIIGDLITTLLGVVLTVFAVSSFFFDWPTLRDIKTDTTTAAIGLILLVIDKKKIANKLFSLLSKQK